MLSPKARQLIDAAIADISGPEYRKVWAAWDQAHRDMRASDDSWRNATAALPVDIAVAALCALEEMHRRLRRERERANLSEDEASDLDNDVSHIKAVERFLVQGAP